MARSNESVEIQAIGDQWALIQGQIDAGGLSVMQIASLKAKQLDLNKQAEELRALQGYSGGTDGSSYISLGGSSMADRIYNPPVDVVGVCPITVDDVANTRGLAFVNLSPQQQLACGGSGGYIYQEGLKRAYEKGKEEGMPEIDNSDPPEIYLPDLDWNKLGLYAGLSFIVIFTINKIFD